MQRSPAEPDVEVHEPELVAAENEEEEEATSATTVPEVLKELSLQLVALRRSVNVIRDQQRESRLHAAATSDTIDLIKTDLHALGNGLDTVRRMCSSSSGVQQLYGVQQLMAAVNALTMHHVQTYELHINADSTWARVVSELPFIDESVCLVFGPDVTLRSTIVAARSTGVDTSNIDTLVNFVGNTFHHMRVMHTPSTVYATATLLRRVYMESTTPLVTPPLPAAAP